MTRMTIDYGIDLGTTNSSIAVLQEKETEIIQNHEGQKYTPSVIWIDNQERLFVGNRAKNQIEFDSENTHSEFKLQMGSKHLYTFLNTPRQFKAEELSAEVIKSLREDVRQHKGEDVTAAVITVPAAFELPQCEATTQAAKLAGLEESPLVQEPVAAALAYGFQNESQKNTFWLVYDLGGGTFDAAIVSLREGSIQILNHGGDNHLGGKLVDWAIVDNLFVPELETYYNLKEFHRGNPAYRSAFAKMKRYAEEAKIQLTKNESAQIIIEPLCPDNNGSWISFDYNLTQNQLESLITPFASRTLNICKKVLSESNLGADDIEKLILVGGPSQSPMLREMLSSELGIPLEYSIDPLTVVSRGAAVFAGTQQRSSKQPRPVLKDSIEINLQYDSIDNDPEPLVVGRIHPPKDQSNELWTVEFVETQSKWRSGAITLEENLCFKTNLLAEPGRTNEYEIILKDHRGNPYPANPDRITYLIGNTITAQPLIHSIGVALGNNKVSQFLKKGSDLPVRHRQVFQTTQNIRKGESATFLNIPIIEGEFLERADRNSLIGTLQVRGENIRRDVKAGSEVEITIIINESRQVHTLAYVPVLDEEFEKVLHLEKTSAEWEELETQIRDEKVRMKDFQEKICDTECEHASEKIQQLEREQILLDLDQSLIAARSDYDARDKCQSRLMDLKRSLDEVESDMEWPSLVWDARKLIEQVQTRLEGVTFSSHRTVYLILREEIEQAIGNQNIHELKNRYDQLHEVYREILVHDPNYWVGCYHYLRDQKESMSDPIQAERCLKQGQKALDSRNVQLLETSVRQLITLLPEEEQTEMQNTLNSTIMPMVKS